MTSYFFSTAICFTPCVVSACNCSSEMKLCVLFSLCVSHSLGIVLVLVIIKTSEKQEPDKGIKGSTVLMKMKLISLFIFGSCYLIHCGLHIWKNLLENVNIPISFLNCAVTVLHIICTSLFSMFYKRAFDHTSCFCCVCLVILSILTYIGFTIDALSLDTLPDAQSNYTSSSQNVTRVVEVIELTKPLISSAIIGFSLLTIDFLFMNIDDRTFIDSPDADSRDPIKNYIKTFVQQLFFLASFAMFVFPFLELLTNDPSSDLKAFIITQIVMKSVVFVILITVIFTCCCNRHELKPFFKKIIRSPWMIIMIISFLSNLSYHILNCIIPLDLKDTEIEIFVLIDNVISAVIAFVQTIFIFVSYSEKKNKHETESRKCCTKCCTTRLPMYKEYVHFAYSLLGMLNIGFLVGDIIGKDRLLYDIDDNLEIIKLFRNVLSMLSIFFLFQNGLEFLKLYLIH